ncbi:MAG: LamG domain-containing protein [Candidatus Hermodarchaeota archaeon]
MPDGWEVQYSLNPLNATDAADDPDLDGLTNLEEYQTGTDPTDDDTDGDGYLDGVDPDPLDPDIPGSNFALDFDGSNDYVDCGNDASLVITGALTVEIWFKPDTLVGLSKTLISKGQSGFSYQYGSYGLYLSFTGYLYWDLYFTDGSTYERRTISYRPTGGFQTDLWYHVAGVWDGTLNTGAIKLYMNGQLVGTNTPTKSQLNAPSGNYNLTIGRNTYSQSMYFNGAIDEVRILSRALNSTEILTDYNAPFGQYAPQPDTVVWYHLDEGEGSSIGDASGNGHTGTIYGALWIERN